MTTAFSLAVEAREIAAATVLNRAELSDCLEQLAAAVAADAHTIGKLQREAGQHRALMAQIGAYARNVTTAPYGHNESASSEAVASAASPAVATVAVTQPGGADVVPLLHVVSGGEAG